MSRWSFVSLALVAFLLAGCDAGEVVEDQNLPAPQSVHEVRSQETINRFFEAVGDEDWDEACEQLAPQAVRQIARAAKAPASAPCADLLSVALAEAPTDLGRVEVTEATPSSGEGVSVETAAGDGFTLDDQYRIVELVPPE